MRGPKYVNLTTFKEKAGLISLFMKKESEDVSVLKAVGNNESLEDF